jgi:hypothetical protein
MGNARSSGFPMLSPRKQSGPRRPTCTGPIAYFRGPTPRGDATPQAAGKQPGAGASDFLTARKISIGRRLQLASYERFRNALSASGPFNAGPLNARPV